MVFFFCFFTHFRYMQGEFLMHNKMRMFLMIFLNMLRELLMHNEIYSFGVVCAPLIAETQPCMVLSIVVCVACGQESR